jgi:hypothetical protein
MLTVLTNQTHIEQQRQDQRQLFASFAVRAKGILITAVARAHWGAAHQVIKDFILFSVRSYSKDYTFILCHPQAHKLIEIKLLLNRLRDKPENVLLLSTLERLYVAFCGINDRDDDRQKKWA